LGPYYPRICKAGLSKIKVAEKINAYGNCVKNYLKKIVILEDLEVNGRIILRCSLNKWVERMEVGL